jgi:hypothetical protein
MELNRSVIFFLKKGNEETMNNYQKCTIDTIGNGDAKDKFNFELGKAFQDCLDLNKDVKKSRKVTLEVTMIPSEDRSKIGILYQAKSKLVPDKPGTEHVIMTQDGTPFVNNVEQMDLIDAIQNGKIEHYDAKTGEAK